MILLTLSNSGPFLISITANKSGRPRLSFLGRHFRGNVWYEMEYVHVYACKGWRKFV